ncbi:MAG: TIGR03364 family FAD-dependent oxidoreductase [Planctomycetota bacterium]
MVATQLGTPKRVGIIGAGIAGLAHAWVAAQRGHQVTVFERSARSSGASIRNFGMIWVIGQPDSMQSIAMNSQSMWLQAAKQAGFWIEPCGSLHLAHHDDEWQLLQEYLDEHRHSPRSSHLRLLDRAETLAKTPAANPSGLLGSLWSDTECCVDPTSAVRSIPAWLHRDYGVVFHFSTAATHVESGLVRTGDGHLHAFDEIVICGGDDFATLFPEAYHGVAIRPCKLHMMRTVEQPHGWRIGPHLAGGLTLRHYPNFKGCPTLAQLQQRIASQAPELDRLGIHVMASQNHLGQVVLGDSHQYGEEVEPFDTCDIDSYILRELEKIICLPTWDLQARWHGVYAKYTGGLVYEQVVAPGVRVFTGLGGNGMTLSFGLAQDAWERWETV